MSLRSVALAVADLLIGNQRWPLSPPNLTAGADYDPHDQFNTDLAALVGPLDVALIDFSGARPLIAMRHESRASPLFEARTCSVWVRPFGAPFQLPSVTAI